MPPPLPPPTPADEWQWIRTIIEEQLELFIKDRQGGRFTPGNEWADHARKELHLKGLSLESDEGKKWAIKRELDVRIEAYKWWRSRHDDEGERLSQEMYRPCDKERRAGLYVNKLVC